jgi:tetratricopeptide (TPR) repeat protein/predicted phosphodiesterase
MGDFQLRVLHISDLHEVGPRAQKTWRHRRVLGDAWKRNLDELTQDGAPVDLVCCTGDVAASGMPVEYGWATDFVSSTLERLALKGDRFFVVPGNHDIQRGTSEKAHKALRAALLALPADVRSRWMVGGRTPAGCDPAQRERVFDRSAGYRGWIRELRGAELLPERSAHGRLGYRATISVRDLPFEIHVVGLDSAWLSGDDDEHGKLLLTEDQIGRLALDQGASLGGLRLALVHHPLGYLADEASARSLLTKHVDLVLCGHLHDEELAGWVDVGQTVRLLAAGCLYDGSSDKGRRNAFHLVDITLDAAGRPRRWDVRLRGFSHGGGGFWFDDGTLHCREAPEGLLAWASKPPPPPPPPPRHEVFVGRDAELLALEQALFPETGTPRTVALCSLHSTPGVGKSMLAERFAVLHAARFKGGVHWLALQPDEARTTGALFGELADRLRVCAAAPDAAERLRDRLRAPPALVLIDNADSWSAANAAIGLAAMLPDCSVVVTGRHRNIGRRPGWVQIDVGPLDEPTAQSLLAAELRAATSAGKGSRMHELASALGGLPLALNLAAAHLRGRTTAGRLLAEIEKSGAGVQPADLASPLLAPQRSRALVAAIVELSLAALEATLGEGAERLLAGFSALGHAPAVGFGRSLGTAIADLPADDFDRLAEAAASLSLLESIEGRQAAWRLHPLVAELLRRRPDAEAVSARITAWFVERLPTLMPAFEALQAQRWREVEQETAAIASWLSTVGSGDLVRVERAGSKYAILNGPFRTWMDFCERGLLVRSDLAERSHFLWTLAQVAIRAGEMDRAMEAATEKESLDWRRGNEREAALAAGCRADILELRGEIDEALRIRRQEEIPVYERVGDLRSRAATMGKIADVLQTRGELDEALRIRRDEQLPAYEQLGHMRSLAVTLGKIAAILQAQGELDEALRIRRAEQLPIYEVLGDVRERAATLGKIAALLKARGEVDEALRLRREEQLPVYERLGDLRALVVGRANLALAYLARGAPGDRETARELLAVARRSAESLRIPEAHQIRRLQAQHGLLPTR